MDDIKKASWPGGALTDAQVKHITESVYDIGFERASMGEYKTHNQVRSYDDKYIVFKRTERIDDLKGKKGNELRPRSLGLKGAPSEPLKNQCFETGGKRPLGSAGTSFPPMISLNKKMRPKGRTSEANNNEIATAIMAATDPGSTLPALTSFEGLDILQDLVGDSVCIDIGYDSEWWYPEAVDGESAEGSPRCMLSWQFTVIWRSLIYEYVIFPVHYGDRIKLDEVLGFLLDELGLFEPVPRTVLEKFMYCRLSANGLPEVKTTHNKDVAIANCYYPYFKNSIDPATKRRAHPRDRFRTTTPITEMPDRNVPWAQREWAYYHRYISLDKVNKIPVTLVSHSGTVDLSALAVRGSSHILAADSDSDKRVVSLFRNTANIQGGVVSTKAISLAIRSFGKDINNAYYYPVNMVMRDTMCYAAQGSQSLEKLGDAVGYDKINIAGLMSADIRQKYDVYVAYEDDDDGKSRDKKFNQYIKGHMRDFLFEDPCLYMEYAIRDAVVTLLYADSLFGINRSKPFTATEAGATIAKREFMKYLGLKNDDDFNIIWRGLKTIDDGSKPASGSWLQGNHLEPISDDVSRVLNQACQSYHGGLNMCSEVGYFPMLMHDFDLKNAYPTAMCLTVDCDYDDPIQRTVRHEELKLSDWHVAGNVYNPFLMFFGYVRFEFPKDVPYPCIPCVVKDVPVFPRTSHNAGVTNDYVYACGPEIYLALRLGATVYCDTGYFLRTKVNKSGEESHSLQTVVKKLVQAREEAERIYGKHSIQAMLLKLIVNALYGKIAQNVKPKHTYNPGTDSMEDARMSKVTNPVLASMITSITRAILLAAMNELTNLGYKCVSVTTDGFITDAPYEVLDSLDLYGMNSWIRSIRKFLTRKESESDEPSNEPDDDADPSMWAEKHRMDDLINITTRGNMSLHDATNKIIDYGTHEEYEGVCAHAGIKTGFESGSYEDRLDFIIRCLTRTGPVMWDSYEWSSFRDFAYGLDFEITKRTKACRMDYDCKRKPIRESIYDQTVTIEGFDYTIAHIDTVAYEDVDEYQLYRDKRDLCTVGIRERLNSKTSKWERVKVFVSCLRTRADWDAFFSKIDYGCGGAHIRDIKRKMIFDAVAGHRQGKWYIPQLDEGSCKDKLAFINRFNECDKPFSIDDWKEARKPERIKNIMSYEELQDLIDAMSSEVA